MADNKKSCNSPRALAGRHWLFMLAPSACGNSIRHQAHFTWAPAARLTPAGRQPVLTFTCGGGVY